MDSSRAIQSTSDILSCHDFQSGYEDVRATCEANYSLSRCLALVGFERYVGTGDHPSHAVELLWLSGQDFTRLDHLAALLAAIGHRSDAPAVLLGPYTSGALRSWLAEEEAESAALLWDRLTRFPSSVTTILCGDSCSEDDAQQEQNRPREVGSDLIEDQRKNLRIVSSWATAPLDLLFDREDYRISHPTNAHSVESLLRRRMGVHSFRSVVTRDDIVLREVLTETEGPRHLSRTLGPTRYRVGAGHSLWAVPRTDRSSGLAGYGCRLQDPPGEGLWLPPGVRRRAAALGHRVTVRGRGHQMAAVAVTKQRIRCWSGICAGSRRPAWLDWIMCVAWLTSFGSTVMASLTCRPRQEDLLAGRRSSPSASWGPTSMINFLSCRHFGNAFLARLRLRRTLTRGWRMQAITGLRAIWWLVLRMD